VWTALGDPEDVAWNESGPSKPRMMGAGHIMDNKSGRISATFPLASIDEDELEQKIRSASDARKESVYLAYAEQAVINGCEKIVQASR
jgi:hypothetical protein